MSMSAAYRDVVATLGASLVTHVGLIDDQGTELAGGTPAYARLAVSWGPATDGMVRPTGDLVFNVPAGAIVGGWRGYSAATDGTDYGGAELPADPFSRQGEYILSAEGTGIGHRDA